MCFRHQCRLQHRGLLGFRLVEIAVRIDDDPVSCASPGRAFRGRLGGYIRQRCGVERRCGSAGLNALARRNLRDLDGACVCLCGGGSLGTGRFRGGRGRGCRRYGKRIVDLRLDGTGLRGGLRGSGLCSARRFSGRLNSLPSCAPGTGSGSAKSLDGWLDASLSTLAEAGDGCADRSDEGADFVCIALVWTAPGSGREPWSPGDPSGGGGSGSGSGAASKPWLGPSGATGCSSEGVICSRSSSVVSPRMRSSDLLLLGRCRSRAAWGSSAVLVWLGTETVSSGIAIGLRLGLHRLLGLGNERHFRL